MDACKHIWKDRLDIKNSDFDGAIILILGHDQK